MDRTAIENPLVGFVNWVLLLQLFCSSYAPSDSLDQTRNRSESWKARGSSLHVRTPSGLGSALRDPPLLQPRRSLCLHSELRLTRQPSSTSGSRNPKSTRGV